MKQLEEHTLRYYKFGILASQCLEVIKAGLADPEVRPSRRYLLYQRAEKICGNPNSKYADQLTKIEPVKVTEAPEVSTVTFLSFQTDRQTV